MIIKNTDAWDSKEFISHLQSDNKLRDAEIEGSKHIPEFTEFMFDVFSGLYKYNPEVKNNDDIPKQFKWMKDTYDELTKLQEWKVLRSRTKMDSVLSAQATADFCIDIANKINKNNDSNKNSDKSMSSFRHAARNTLKSTLTKIDELNEMIGIFGYSNKDNGNIHKSNINNKKELANKINNSEIIKKIAKLAGRFQNIAVKKQKSKTNYGTNEISNISIGDDISRILPAELMKIGHKNLKYEFMKKFIEKNLMQYKLTGKETIGKGPIIVCIDESSTMRGNRDVWAKAITMALIKIAAIQNRKLCIIHYNRDVTRIDKFDKNTDPLDIIDAMCYFTGGSTNFMNPLNSAVNIISDKSNKDYKNADIVFITDGECTITQEFLDLFLKAKRISEFQVISLIIGSNNRSVLEKFSDKLIHVDINSDSEVIDTVFSI